MILLSKEFHPPSAVVATHQSLPHNGSQTVERPSRPGRSTALHTTPGFPRRACITPQSSFTRAAGAITRCHKLSQRIRSCKAYCLWHKIPDDVSLEQATTSRQDTFALCAGAPLDYAEMPKDISLDILICKHA